MLYKHRFDGLAAWRRKPPPASWTCPTWSLQRASGSTDEVIRLRQHCGSRLAVYSR